MRDPKPLIFEPYLAGLRKFAKEIGKQHPAVLPLCTFEQRLLENARCTCAFGDTDTLKAERSAIIQELNALAIEVLSTSLNDLCNARSLDGVSLLPYSTVPGESAGTAPLVVLRGWDKNSQIAATYRDSIKQFLLHVGRQDYEEAKHLYWQLVYFLGTRELWNECKLLSSRLLKLSDREGDPKTKGLVLVTGRAWPLLSKGHFQQARGILSEAFHCFHATAANSDLAVFYEYMADVENESKNVGQALSYYREAITRSSGIDAHKIRLKMQFSEVQSERDSSRSKLIALSLLRDSFQELRSYKEGMVLIEMAKTLYRLKSVEALETARLAYSLLNNDIMMPSNAKKAKNLLNTILEKRPCPETFVSAQTSLEVPPDAVDVIVYVALGEEFSVALKHFGKGFVRDEISDLAVTVYRGTVSTDGPEPSCSVILIPAGTMGNTRSSNVISAFLAKNKARNVVALGIAGSIGDDLQLGDVFVPQSVNEYMANAAGVGSDTLSFIPSGNRLPIDPRLLNRTQLFSVDHPEKHQAWKRRAAGSWKSLVSGAMINRLKSASINLRGCSVVISGDDRILGSGPAVSKDIAFARWIRASTRKTEAVEMESAGVLDAAFIRTPAPRAYVIRGISDYGDSRKAIIEAATKGAFRRLAVDNATGYLLSVMRAGLFSL